MNRYVKRLLPLFMLLLVLGGGLVALTQRWAIYDWWRLRNYDPPAAITKLATETTMTESSRRVFYANHPELQSLEDFRSSCTSSEQTIVLGCFVPAVGIFMHNIEDERLSGVLEVTAAHELLHAAYQRLSNGDRQEINRLLNQAFQQLDDDRIKETVDNYRKNGADVDNELHSILGTEVRELPEALETYYRRYFDDRLLIVKYSEQYEAAFTARKKQVAAYDKQLADLKKRIDTQQASLNQQSARLQSERDRLESLMAAKNYDGYNAAVPGFNRQVNDYNASVAAVRSLIGKYNDIVAKRNAVALEENELIKAIDSRPDTIPSE